MSENNKTSEMSYEVLKQYQALKAKLTDLEKTLIHEFKTNLKNLFINNPNLVNISMHVNNHEFNDGEPTVFTLSYEDVVITDNEGEEIERNSWNDEDDTQNHPLVKPVFELFHKYDSADIYERLYGDEYDSLEISRKKALAYNGSNDNEE